MKDGSEAEFGAGEVLSISPDSVGKDDPQDPAKDKSQQGAQNAKSAGDD